MRAWWATINPILRVAPRWRVALVTLVGAMIALGAVSIGVDAMLALVDGLLGRREITIGWAVDVASVVSPVILYWYRWELAALATIALIWKSPSAQRKANELDDDD